jgi:titin
MNSTVSRRVRIAAIISSVVVIGAFLVALPQAATAGPTTVTKTYSYTGSIDTFTVPAGISALTITVVGAEGGNGGADATPAPAAGGYRGVVTGTLAVTPNQVLTVAVGRHGSTGASRINANTPAAAGGLNPLGGYAGGNGGLAGTQGSSGQGGAGGAASVLQVSGSSIVAAGGGGSGGSGQFPSTQGHTATASYAGRTDTTSTSGQRGQDAAAACAAASCNNDDGGGSGGGGGGAQGGATGDIQFGAGTSNEWYGFGGSVGQNSTGSLSDLVSSYQYYADNVTDGSIVISYTTGSPAAPTAVTGTAGNASVTLAWTAPTDPGQSAISSYVVRYSSNGGSTWSTAVDLGGTAISGTVTGLTNGTAYIFEVAAVNSVGTGPYSVASSSVTPLGPPSAPTVNFVTAQDGALALSLTAPTSGAAVTGYDYRVDNGSWVAVASTSTTLVIPGLVNGTGYTIEVRAQSAVGAGESSLPVSGTPQAVPGAPTISSLAVGNGSLSVAFTPGFNGGGVISSYQYRLNGGNWVTATGVTSPIAIAGLSAGTDYSVELRAINSAGAGAPSAPAMVMTPGAPGAPTVGSVIAGDGTVIVNFTPGSTGGTPIDHYQYQTETAGSWFTASTSTSPITVTGLSNGTPVTVSIRAVNAVGAGTASTPVTVTPATVPGAPAIVGDTVAGSDAQLSAAFTAPASDGGSAIIRYQYSTDGGATWRDRDDTMTTASPVVITSLSSDGVTALVNGTTYFVELRAVNAIGAGTASAVAEGIATTTPSAPTISSVTASPGALQVAFDSAANGGSAITAYQYSIDGGSHWISTGGLGGSFGISGLTNGTRYTVLVRAVNSIGDGAASAGVDGTPVALPGQPTIDSVVRSNQTLTAVAHLADNGGSPITAWQYSTDNGASWATASSPTSPLTLTTLSSDSRARLANGTGYALQLRAVTAVGTGPASATTIVAPAAVPAAPSIALTAGDGNIAVAFALGADGGSPVTNLEYSLDGGAHWVDPGTLSSPFTIVSLSNGTAYAVMLRADNAIGDGAPSVPASTTPRTVPGAPNSVAAVSNSSSADVTWVAPSVTGGAPISGYTASAYSSGTSTTPISSCTTTATSCSINSLSNGTAYYLAVSASNSAGTGASSAPRVLVTPLARPAAPTLTGLSTGDSSISVAFTAGAAGDRSITGYQYSTDGGTSWAAATGSSSPILVTGLTDGTAYTIALRAVSSAGVGATSNTLIGTPYTYPSAPDPSTIVVNAGDGQVAVSWAAASLNGGTLLNYTATAFSGLNSGTTVRTCSTASLSCTITGLTNGTTYYISLQTENTAAMYSVRSDPRVPATPAREPGAPTSVAAVGGDAQATVSWTAPTSTGVGALTGYTVWCSVAGAGYTTCGSATGTSTTITGLSNGTSYTFEVTASNSGYTSSLSTASTAVVPLAAGIAPTFAAPVATTNGFTSSISNWDSATTYSVSATNGASAALSGSGVITVTGLSDGAGSRLVVAAVRFGETATTGALDGAALLTGVAPTFSGDAALPDGFSFTIANYAATASYSLLTTQGTVTRSGAVVTVAGLDLGESATVTVGVSLPGSTPASATHHAAAMVAGTAPTFSGLVATADGFHVEIANYDSALTYTFATTGGVGVTRSGSTVTVTGVAAGASTTLWVTATLPGVSVATASTVGSALQAGTAPAVSSVTQTVDGFAFTITNPSAAANYSVTSTAGSAVLDGDVVTVTGLTPGQSAVVTVAASEADHATVETTVTATSLLTGITPLFGAPVGTADGFTFVISNFDADGSYQVSVSSGSATVAGSTVTVSGLAPSASATATVTVSHDGYADATSQQSGTALAAGIAPSLADVVATADGFTFTIANYDAALVYTDSVAPAGVVVIAADGTGIVSGEAAGAVVSLTVTATDPGVSVASATAGATVLLPTDPVRLTSSTPSAGGYSFTIVNYDPGVSYAFNQTAGGSVVRSGDTVTVSGLGAAVYSETTVSASSAGHTTVSATVGGTSFPDGTAPAVSAITRTNDGFTFTITLDPGDSYSVASDAGTATLVGSTVTVSGLAVGATTTVHITASAPGVLDETTDVAGTAISAGTAPAFGTPTPASHGYLVTIVNYSSAVSYRLAVSAGTATQSGSRITVGGLAVGARATLTVTAVRGGYRDTAASVIGHALPAPTPPAAITPPVPSAPAPSVSSGPAPATLSAPPSSADVAALPESKTGSGRVQKNGGAVSSQLKTTDSTAALSTGDGLRLTVSARQDGKTLPLAADGVVEVQRDGQLWITVSGLAAQSDVEVWSVSRGSSLGNGMTDAAGRAGQLIRLPHGLTPGAHTLVVTGITESGAPVTLQLGIRVLDVQPSSAVAALDGGWLWLLLLITILLVVLIWCLVAWRRRRREPDEEPREG